MVLEAPSDDGTFGGRVCVTLDVMTIRIELVIAARAGDRQASSDLVELESREAIGLCLSILRCQSDAEYAAQEAFVRAWRGLPSLREAELWAAWFRRLTVTAALDYYRKRRTGKLIPFVDHEPPPLPDAQHALAARDEMRGLSTRLDARDQILLILRLGTAECCLVVVFWSMAPKGRMFLRPSFTTPGPADSTKPARCFTHATPPLRRGLPTAGSW